MRLRSCLISFAFVFCAVFPVCAAGAGKPFEARLVTGTLKVFPDAKPVGKAGAAYKMQAVRNEYAPFQVVVYASKDISGVSVEMSALKGPKGSIPVGAGAMLSVENVFVSTPTIPVPDDMFKPKLWPDPLPPLKKFDVKKGIARASWIDLYIPAGTAPGVYKGVVTVSSKNGGKQTLPVEIDVADVSIPTAPTLSTAFGNWGSGGCVEKAYGIKPGSPESNKLREDTYWFLVEHRLSPYDIPVDLFSEEAHKYLDDPRVTSFVIPLPGGASEGGKLWDDEYMKKLNDHLVRTGWIDKGVLYLFDEPKPDAYEALIKAGQRIKAINPKLRFLMTPNSDNVLASRRIIKESNINVWIPILSVMSNPMSKKALLKEQARGKELWWYTCIGPKWKGMNYFLDEVATAPRLHPWMNYLYGNTGILYWATDYWGEVGCDPWTNTMTFPLVNGNGDGSLMYPGGKVGHNGPVASLRLKMLREGMEDYELLKVLGSALQAAAARIGGGASDYKPESRLFEHAFALIKEEGRSSKLGADTPYLTQVTQDYRDIEKERSIVVEEILQAKQSPLLLVETKPADKAYTTLSDAKVKIYAETGAAVTVNGKKAPLSDNAAEVSIPLKMGRNIVTIKATGKNGRTKTAVRELYRRD